MTQGISAMDYLVLRLTREANRSDWERLRMVLVDNELGREEGDGIVVEDYKVQCKALQPSNARRRLCAKPKNNWDLPSCSSGLTSQEDAKSACRGGSARSAAACPLWPAHK